jgi:hypothetical protein
VTTDMASLFSNDEEGAKYLGQMKDFVDEDL